MYRKLIFIITILFSVIGPAADLLEPHADQAPILCGSRTIYVKNYDDTIGNSLTMLKLYLRSCSCEKNGKRKSKVDQRICFFCACWSDSRKEDQPAIQGSPIGIYLTLSSLKSSLFLKVDSDKNNELFFWLPSPSCLAVLLEIIGAKNLVEMVSSKDPVNVDDYLSLISQKKIPLNSPEASKEREELIYQMYFHDVFNHLAFWIFAPDMYREQIATKTKTFLAVGNFLAKTFSHEQDAIDFLALMKIFFSVKFDSRMGSANNKIFTVDSFLSIKNLAINLSIDDNGDYLRKVYDLTSSLEPSLNFGLEIEGQSLFIRTEFDSRIFVHKWIKEYGKFLVDQFDQIRNVEDVSLFDSFNAIKQDKRSHQAFLRLRLSSAQRLKGIVKNFDGEIIKFLNISGSSYKHSHLFSTPAFGLEMYLNIQEAEKKYRRVSQKTNNNF